jgi:hypothetical protein
MANAPIKIRDVTNRYATIEKCPAPLLRGLVFGLALSLPIWIATVYLAVRFT